MKLFKSFVIALIVSSIIVYMVGSLSNAHLNISHWGEVSRDMLAMFWGAIVFFIIVMTTDSHHNN